MAMNAVVDERTLREIYLASFETAIKEGKPWTVMCAYNRLNGEFGSENKKVLNDVLRDEWAYEGLVVTDWGATNDRVKGLEAGQDLEMPSSGGVSIPFSIRHSTTVSPDNAINNPSLADMRQAAVDF